MAGTFDLAGLIYAQGQPKMCAQCLRGDDAARVVDRSLKRQSGHRTNAGDRHQAARNLVLTRQRGKVRSGRTRAFATWTGVTGVAMAA